MLIDELVKKHVVIHERILPRAKKFQITPLTCPLCGHRICGNLPFYCTDECTQDNLRSEDSCNNECCGEIEDIYTVLKRRYPELSEYAYNWWNKYRKTWTPDTYQEYPAASYILKMINILWCLDQKHHFTEIQDILTDRLFEI